MRSTRWRSSAWCRARRPRRSGTVDQNSPPFDVARIDAIEAETKHDVIAFLTYVAEQTGPAARFLHQGMTSSDVLDTCLAVQLARAADILLADLDALLAVLKRRAVEHKLHADDRPQPRHPCRAGHLRAQAGAGLCRVRPRPRPAGGGARGDRHLRDLRRGRHLRQYRSARRGACRREDGAGGRADLHPGDPARPARHVLRDARRDRLVDRAAGDRDPPSAAHRSARGRGIFRARARRAARRCRTSATRC